MSDINALVGHYKDPIKVTVSFLGLYYAFLSLQSFSKFYIFNKAKTESKGEKVNFAKIKYGSTDRIALMGDRSVGNLLEQSVPFLTSLWLHAVFVSPQSAATLGWAYLGFRSIYPVVFYKGLPYLFLSTIPGYAIIGALLKPLIGI